MLILSVEEARPGMTLAAPVCHPENPDQDLLKAGYVLESRVLHRLRDMGVQCLYVGYPALDELDRHLGAMLSPARQVVYNQIKRTIAAAQRSSHPAVSYDDYYHGTRDLIETLLGQGQHPIYMDQMARMGGDAVGHATSVAHLSLLLGIKLERYLIDQRKRLPAHHAKEVVNLGVAGMLHDVGKGQLPEALRCHTGAQPPEKDEDRKEWENHSRLGYEAIHDGIEPSAASAVLHHHQHFDGSGFPAARHKDGSVTRFSGTGIHVFARILQAADLYDRLAAPIGVAQRRPNVEVLHLMRTQYAGWIDPTILGMLQSVCPPFLPGSKVGLSDGTQAIVVDASGADPYRPIVRRIIGKHDLELDEHRVNLSDAGAPTIQTAGGKPVSQMLPEAAPAATTAA